MAKIIEASLDGTNLKVAIVASRFNEFITTKLIEGAKDCLLRHNVNDDDIDIVWIPGAFEMPLIAQKLAESNKYDFILTVGAVIRGETPHFDYVAAENAKGIATASMKTGVPIIYSVLTTDTNEQAIDRAGLKSGNKGWQGALAGIEMANLIKGM